MHSSHFDSGPKDGKETSNKQGRWPGTNIFVDIEEVGCHKIIQKVIFNYRCEKYDTDVKCM
jgi:hypothetical protein